MSLESTAAIPSNNSFIENEGEITYIASDSNLGQSYDYLFKILLVGNSGTGKSSIVEQFTEKTFHSGFVSTIGVDFKIMTIKHKGKIIKLQIWDTAGQERFRSITASYYRGSNAIMVVYDVTDPVTLKHGVSTWIKEIEKYALENVRLLFVGNKADLTKQYEDKVNETKVLLKGYKKQSPEKLMDNIFTSAKTGENIEAAFIKMVNILMEEQTKFDAEKTKNGGKNGLENNRLHRGPNVRLGKPEAQQTQTGGGCC